jgi:arginase
MKKVRIIGVPMDLGAGRRGVDMGPSVIRVGGLHKRLDELDLVVEDFGNIEVRIAEQFHYGEKTRMYLEEIAQVCRGLARLVAQTLEEGTFPLVLGGDHSIAVGSVAGTSAFYRQRDQKIGLIWIDAHTDINVPESSLSGNVHGMPLAALLGLGPSELSDIEDFAPKVLGVNTTVVGVRSVDAAEKLNIEKCGVRVVSMKELDMRGMKAVMEEAMERATRDTIGFHCSLDLDAVDPRFAPGVGTPVPGGMTYRESHLAMEMVYDSGKLLSMDCVEVNPVLDEENSTGLLSVELISSALGKKIL